MSQPRESAWPVTRSAEPARPARASRRKSAWYLLSTAETARALVMASAATVAARSSRCTSSSLISPLGGEGDEASVVERAGHDADDDAGGGRAAGGTRAHRLGLDDEPARRRRSSRGRSTCSRPPALASTRPSGVVTMADPAADADELLAQAVEPAAGQHDLDQRLVGLLRAGQHGGLPVEHLGEHLVDDVVEAHGVGQPDDRQAEPVGLLEHRRGQLVQVAAELDRQAGEAAAGQLPDERGQALGDGAQGVAGGQQQLLRLDPRQDVGHLHDVQAAHHAGQARPPGEDLGAGEAGQLEHGREAQSLPRHAVPLARGAVARRRRGEGAARRVGWQVPANRSRILGTFTHARDCTGGVSVGPGHPRNLAPGPRRPRRRSPETRTPAP